MKVETREDCAEASALMADVLREGAPVDAEYPLVFGSAAPGRIVVVEEEGGVRSTCAVLARDLVLPDARIRVGMIGSVSTDPEFRGRGLATQVLAAAEEELRLDGCLFSLLWADDEDFYLKRGYSRIGTEIDFALSVDMLKALPSSDEVRILEPEDTKHVHGLYGRHPERVERTMLETEALLATPGMEVLVAEEGGKVSAYACLGRGGDMTNVIHEWGGDANAVGACIHAHMRRRAMKGDSSDLYLIAPPSAHELNEYLTGLGASSATGVLGMGKLLNLDKLVELYSWFLGPDGDVRIDQRPAEVSENGEPGIRIQGPNKALLFSADAAFRAMFSTDSGRAEVESLQETLGLELSGLPMTPFVWGLDSI